MPNTLKNKQLVFITGPAGSGTTMLSRFLSAPDFSVGLTRYSCTTGYERQSEYMDEVTHKMWHISNASQNANRKTLGESLKNIPVDTSSTHVVLKRSCPFTNINFLPVLSDVSGIFPNVKFIICKRDPRSCATSILRRNICGDIDTAILWTKKVFLHIHAQLRIMDTEAYRVFQYEEFIEKPGFFIPEMESFLSFPKASLVNFTSMIKAPTCESGILTQQYSASLDQAFDDFQVEF